MFVYLNVSSFLPTKFSASLKRLTTRGIYFGAFASLLAEISFKESVKSYCFINLSYFVFAVEIELYLSDHVTLSYLLHAFPNLHYNY